MEISKLPTIQDLIKNKIYRRVLVCLFFVFLSFSLATTYDIYSSVPALKEKVLSISEDVSDFVVSQTLLNNEESISAQISEDGDKNKMKIQWNKSDLSKKNGSLEWVFPFSWRYSKNVVSIDGKNYGSIYIYGSLLNDNIFVEHFISKLFFSVFSVLFVFFCLRPLFKRIPNDLFLSPINYVFYFIKNGCIDSDIIVADKCGTREIYHLAKRFSELISLEKEHTKERALVEFSKQIAHDIRAPVSAILALSSELSFLPENSRISLRNAMRRIDAIANKLLYFSGENFSLNTNSTFLLSSAILSVVSEKEILCKKNGITISFYSEPGMEFSFISSNLCDFQRILSNIINNSIEAISGSGAIKVNIHLENNHICLSISDTGKGMSNKTIDDILSGKIVSEKKYGLGIGLSHAIKFIKEHGGDINIISMVGTGTTIKIKLKEEKKPAWLCDKIRFFKNGSIVILDDDDLVHFVWSDFFSEEIKNNNVKIIHFKKSDECVTYVSRLTEDEKKSIICLVDYDLIGCESSGLDIINMIKPIHSILVTGFFEEENVIKNALLSNVKIIPKSLISCIKKEVIDIMQIYYTSLAEIVLLDDNIEFSNMLSFLCLTKNRKIDIYNDTYEFFDKIESYDRKTTKICLDHDISSLVNGFDVAKILFGKGFYNLYLVSGNNFRKEDVPHYIQVLPSKTSILNL